MRDFPSPRMGRRQEDRIWSRLSWARSKRLPRSTLHAYSRRYPDRVRAVFADSRCLSALQSWMENERGFPAGTPDLVFH